MYSYDIPKNILSIYLEYLSNPLRILRRSVSTPPPQEGIITWGRTGLYRK